MIGFVPDDPHPAKCLPSSGFATFSHPMGEGHLPLPRAKDILPQLPLAERENRSPFFQKMCDGIGRTIIRKTRTVQW
jgi:hypothetical protein